VAIGQVAEKEIRWCQACLCHRRRAEELISLLWILEIKKCGVCITKMQMYKWTLQLGQLQLEVISLSCKLLYGFVFFKLMK